MLKHMASGFLTFSIMGAALYTLGAAFILAKQAIKTYEKDKDIDTFLLTMGLPVVMMVMVAAIMWAMTV